MAWAFRAASSAVNSSYAEATIVITKPTGTVDGDWMFAAIHGDDGFDGDAAKPTGWTFISENQIGAVANWTAFYYKKAASEGASYTWTDTADNDFSGGIVSYSGLHATAPLDTSLGQDNASSVSITSPSINTAEDNELLIFVGAGNEDDGATTHTPPSGMTERVDIFNTWTNLIIADVNVASAGATGTKVATATNAYVNAGFVVAFKQAAAVTTRSYKLPLLGVS